MARQITAEEGGMDGMMHSVMLWNYHSCVRKVAFHLYAGMGGGGGSVLPLGLWNKANAI